MTFVHQALYYATVDEFLAGTVDFVRAGIALDEPTLVAVPGARLDLLRTALCAPRDGVWFADMAEAGRNPARIIPWVLVAFAEGHPGRVRIIGEPIFVGRTDAELGPCVQHEALINVAFAGRDATILCPYDTAQLPEVVAHAERTHPEIVSASGYRASHDYMAAVDVVAMFNRPLPEPGRVDHQFQFDLGTLAGLRRIVLAHAATAGLPPERCEDLQLAVTEICTNAVIHDGDGQGTIRMWRELDAVGRLDAVVCEVYGAGRIADPMAGRIVPSPERSHGRGLLLANRLCDLVQTHVAATGTRTRLRMALSPN